MDRRPDFIPAAVWRFYRELVDGDLFNDHARDKALVARLFGPDMALTWRNLSRQIEGAPIDLAPHQYPHFGRIADKHGLTLREAVAEQDWRLLFDLIMQSRVTLNPEARDAIKRAEELLGEIGETAERLAELLREYRSIRSHHQFTAPPAFGILSEWLEATTGEPEPARDYPAPVDMVESLAFSAWYHEIEPDEIDAAFIHDRKFSRVSAWVRHFDALWDRWQAVMVARFEISNTDLARIASAVLRLDVSREAVKKARAKPDPQDKAELFGPE